jgi:hypothetical protein
MIVHHLIFEDMRHARLLDGRIGALRIPLHDELDFGDSVGVIKGSQLLFAMEKHAQLTQVTCQPQLAAYLFTLTRKPRLMNHYFPITRALDRHAEAEFHKLIARIAQHPAFDLRLFGVGSKDRTAELPPDAGYLVAGHIAEIFFYRQDLLEQLLHKRRGFFLYTTPQAFKDDGGAAGGCFSPQRDAIQLVLARLYEGFYAPTPGVAPFIHEFGHMLDYATGNRGLLPGMESVLDLYRYGKKLELERYEALRRGERPDKLPIGHPYVFQNDGEFAAGYLEMFFRNPHYFAHLNEDLFQAFAQCLKQDPRAYWREDFPFYIQQNKDYYAEYRPPKPGITIP